MIPFVSPITNEPLTRKGDSFVAGEAKYPIIRGIPRFVDADNYAQAFGLQWTTHRQTQLDSVLNTTISRDRLESCLGHPIADLAGCTVLEAGCGAGRFTEWLVQSGAFVHSIDLSMAVEANKETIGERNNYVVAQANILSLPFPQASFDYVICLGVLQHLPSPEAGIEALWAMVKPGGRLVFDHYSWNIRMATKLALLIRPWMKRLPPAQSQRLVEGFVRFFFPIHWAVRKYYPLQMILSRISPITFYYHTFPYLTKEQHYQFSRLDTYDGLTDYYKHFRTKSQLQKFMTSLKAENLHVESISTWIRVSAKKPLQ